MIPCNELHVWVLSIRQLMPIKGKLLKLFSTHDTCAKKSFLTTSLLKIMMASYLRVNPRNVAFGYGSWGKPYLLNNVNKIFFNMTHSDDLVAIGVAVENELGIDLECIKEIDEMSPVAHHFFNKQEQNCYQKASESQKSKTFYQLWTRKEAIGKAKGIGLLINNEHLQYSSVDDKCFVYDLDLKNNYACAVATKNKIEKIRFLNMDDLDLFYF